MGCTLSNANSGRARQVGVPIARQLLGVMVDQGAYSGSIVTSGTFSEDARHFAEGKPMELVDGARLERMIMEVRRGKRASSPPPDTGQARWRHAMSPLRFAACTEEQHGTELTRVRSSTAARPFRSGRYIRP